MKPVLLIDFGSTYTKVTAVDLDSESLMGTASSYTTVQSDINEGLSHGMALLKEQIGDISFDECYACSSAAGGLRMVCSGLVTELTAEAARQACLGAGAKVVKCYSYQLTEEDIEEIEEIKPDIFLLTGGTDGGNSECILHNAKMLAECRAEFPIIIAGNRTCSAQCRRLLAGHQVYCCENVMPKFNQLNIEPVQKQIRDIFLEHIVWAKGMSKATDLISGIMMPTPSAMFAAMKLLAEGCIGEAGIGEVVAIDPGGATTDVYSIADGMPQRVNTIIKGLPEPRAKRTVEGDIGMRYSLDGIIEAAGISRISQISGLTETQITELGQLLQTHTDRLADTAELKALDYALAAMAVEIAVTRHAGTIEQTFTPCGEAFVQTGKDLRTVGTLVATGGALIHDPRAREIVSHGMYNKQMPLSLKPVSANILMDHNYILAAMGLLGEHYPMTALRIMKKELSSDGTTK